MVDEKRGSLHTIRHSQSQCLCQSIIQNPNIKNINIYGFEIKLAQFADDTTMIRDGTPDSLQAALNSLEIFGTMSGLKMNTEKTKIISLERKKHSKDKLETTHALQWGFVYWVFNLVWTWRK